MADCTTTNVLQESGEIPASTLVFADFSVPDTGRLDVTLDWTIPSSLVGFYIVPANTCTLAEFNARTCTFVVRSEPVTTKPRKISTPNFAAGNYRWLVANYAIPAGIDVFPDRPAEGHRLRTTGRRSAFRGLSRRRAPCRTIERMTHR